MSLSTTASLACSRCGRQNQATIWASVNVTQHPELKAPLLAGAINVFNCAYCGARVTIVNDLLYHDISQSLAVWLRHPETQDDNATPTSFGTLTFPRGYSCRIVHTSPDLHEKILIFDAGLNDLAVEAYKVAHSLRHRIPFSTPFQFNELTKPLFGPRALIFTVGAAARRERLSIPLKNFELLLGRLFAGHEVIAPSPWVLVDRDTSYSNLKESGLLNRIPFER